MGNAINNTGNQASNAGGLADMLNRMASGRQGDESGSESFSRWMSQHQGAQPGSLAAPPGARTTPAAAPVRPPTASALSSLGGARLQAARAAQQTPSTSIESDRATSSQAARAEARSAKARSEQAPKPAQRPTSSTSGHPAHASQNGQAAQAARSARSAGGPQDAQRPDGDSLADQVEGKTDELTRFTTAFGEGSAEVRELTPPTDVQANDSASMMAWLVSLTQPDVAQASLADAATEGNAASDEGVTDTPPGLALGRDGDRPDKGRALALGWSLGQRDQALDVRASAASSAAALQVDALLGRGTASSPGQEADPLGALMSADAARASFGQTLSQLTAPRHEQAAIPVPLDAPDFSQKLADQVSLWVGQVKQEGPMTAELHLNPAEMGPINVKISLDGTAAHVDFAAAALETRQAIEASLASLSSALNDVGLSLTGGGVSSQSPQQTLAQGGNPEQGERGARNPQALAPAEGDAGDAAGLHQVSAPRISRLGGLDLYA